jgi:UDP-N-acetylmuramate dehydrogenase
VIATNPKPSPHYPVRVPSPALLSELTTLRLGGPASSLEVASTPEEVASVVGAADRDGRGILVLGGGSNLVIADEGVPGPVVRIGVPGVSVTRLSTDAAAVTIGAGEDWDPVVQRLVDEGWSEAAPLSGIPGSTGATPVQNVGAYGTEISEMLVRVTVYDRISGSLRSIPAEDLELAYRSSKLRGTDRAVVTSVTFRLTQRPVTIRYAELARALGIPVGSSAPAAAVREAVLHLRRGKGMVLDPDDPDTYSVGSFFTNPILSAAALADVDARIRRRLGPDVRYPSYPAPALPESGVAGSVKLSAAWLIERAGFAKGYRGPGGRVALSSKHTLALTNRGGTTAELVALAREIRDGVRDAFGVTLHPEPVFVGVSLD